MQENNYYYHYNRFTALFPGPLGWANARREFWTLWCKERLTEADTPTIPLYRNFCKVWMCHFYSTLQCSHCKRCTSYSNFVHLLHAGIESKRLHVAGCSTVQIALPDSKMLSTFLETKKYSPEMTPFPWNLGSNWPTPSRKQWVLTRFAL